MLAEMNDRETGQATIELVLCLPFAILLIAFVIQVGLVGVEQIRLWHAAREAVRIASVDGDPEAIRAAAESSGLDDVGLTIDPPAPNRTQGGAVRVGLSHHPDTFVPFAGFLLSRITLRADATMRIEQP